MSPERGNFTLLPNQKSMNQKNLSYGQLYYAKLKAKEFGITVDQYLASKGTKRGSKVETNEVTISKPENIDLSKVGKLRNLDITEAMLTRNMTGQPIDQLFSYEGGVPVGTNIMCTGDPGVGKTTVLLHTLANLQVKNRKLNCLFISGEMGKIQMFKYMKRFPIFGELETLFMADFLNSNFKSVVEKILSRGYDYILIDSIVEVFDQVKDDNKISQSQAEKWLIDLCAKNNEGANDRQCFSTFFLIQQVTKSGVFVGSNKVKHLVDSHMELRRESDRDGGGTYIEFTKNRNGQSGMKFGYQLSNNCIEYGTVVEDEVESATISFDLKNEIGIDL